ncbi:hypothetical protein HDU91_006603 [Kappamyces sp. JEL0680]|nr:hypothetical protein HDU91_006603 [Kappamyces sp. JEL0680]
MQYVLPKTCHRTRAESTEYASLCHVLLYAYKHNLNLVCPSNLFAKDFLEKYLAMDTDKWLVGHMSLDRESIRFSRKAIVEQLHALDDADALVLDALLEPDSADSPVY